MILFSAAQPTAVAGVILEGTGPVWLVFDLETTDEAKDIFDPGFEPSAVVLLGATARWSGSGITMDSDIEWRPDLFMSIISSGSAARWTRKLGLITVEGELGAGQNVLIDTLPLNARFWHISQTQFDQEAYCVLRYDDGRCA